MRSTQIENKEISKLYDSVIFEYVHTEKADFYHFGLNNSAFYFVILNLSYTFLLEIQMLKFPRTILICLMKAKLLCSVS